MSEDNIVKHLLDKFTDGLSCVSSLKTAQKFCQKSKDERLNAHSERIVTLEKIIKGNGETGLTGRVVNMEKAAKRIEENSDAMRKELRRWMLGILSALFITVVGVTLK